VKLVGLHNGVKRSHPNIYAVHDSQSYFCRHRAELEMIRERHQREVDEYLNSRRHPTHYQSSDDEYLADGMIQALTMDDAAKRLRTIVRDLMQNCEQPSSRNAEKLANVDHDLSYVQRYLSSGRPYPGGNLSHSLTRHPFTVLQPQPAPAAVQSIVQRVLQGGNERESMIRRVQSENPECHSGIEPQGKPTRDNLNQLIHSINSVKQVMQHPTSKKAGSLDTHLSKNERVQRIKDQLNSSHLQVLHGIQRSASKGSQSNASMDEDPMASHPTEQTVVSPMSERQRIIKNETLQIHQQIEKSIQKSLPKTPPC